MRAAVRRAGRTGEDFPTALKGVRKDLPEPKPPQRFGRWWKGTPDEATPATRLATGKLSADDPRAFMSKPAEAVVEKVRIAQLGPREMQRARRVMDRVRRVATQKSIGQLEALAVVLGMDREAAVALHDLARRIAPGLNATIEDALTQLIALGYPNVTW
jgi:hypothetical protein